MTPTSGADYHQLLFASDLVDEDKDDLSQMSVYHLRDYIREYRRRSDIWDIQRKCFVAHIAKLEQELQGLRGENPNR